MAGLRYHARLNSYQSDHSSPLTSENIDLAFKGVI